MSIRMDDSIGKKLAMPDLADQLERLGNDLLALAAEVKANAKAGADIPPKARLRQSELTLNALELLTSLRPKQKPQDDAEDCEAAVALIRKTRQASVSHFQRRLDWGYNRAARVLSLLQERGIIGEKTGEQAYEIIKMEEQEA